MDDDDKKPPIGDTFEERLARARAGSGKPEDSASEPKGGLALGLRLSLELVSGLVAGAILGWLLDRLFSTAPALMIVLMFFGAAAGLRNMVRLTQRYQRATDDAGPKDDGTDRS